MPAQRKTSSSKVNVQENRAKEKPKPQKKVKPVTPEPTIPTSLTLCSISISILVDDKELPCYGIDCDESTRTAMCFIESQDGKSYEIRFERRSTTSKSKRTDLSVDLYVDGTISESCSALLREDEESFCIDGEYDNDSYRPLQFCRVQTTDDESVTTRLSTADIGSLQVDFRKVKVTKGHHPFRGTSFQETAIDPVIVDEKKKLEGAHATSFGPSQKLTDTTTWHEYNPLKIPNNNPYLKFIFKYRPRNILMANGIIPKEKLQEVNENSYDVEILEIEAQEAAAHAALLAAKAQKAALLRAKSKMKQNANNSVAIKNEEGVIDLTHL